MRALVRTTTVRATTVRSTTVRAAVVVVLGIGLALGAAPTGAQTTPTSTPAAPVTRAQLQLVAQDPWTPLGGETRLGLAVTTPPEDAMVSLTVGQALTTRRQYDSAAQGAPITSVLGQTSVPLAELAVDDDTGRRTLTVGLQSPNDARDATRLNVRRPGVYPLDVELRDADDQTVATLRTMLVVAEADRPTVAEPLGVAWVLPVAAAPSFLPNGEPDREVLASMRPNGRLGEMAFALRTAADVPVTLAPTAETVEAWSGAGTVDPTIESTFDALRAATTGRTVLNGPYVPIDLAALLASGLTSAVDDELARGSDVLARTLGTTLDAHTRLVRPASPAAVTRLRAGGVDQVVVPGDALVGPEARYTLAQPVTLSLPGTSEPVTALPTDTGFEALLTADLPAAQRIQLVLAGLALVALEQPAIPRVVTIVNPDGVHLPAELYGAMLRGLRDNPYLRPMTTAEAFATVPVDPPAPTVTANAATSVRELTVPATAAPSITTEQYRDQRVRLNSFGALTQPGDPAVAEADRSLLASVATGWPSDIAGARARAHLGVVDRVIDELVGLIEVPDPRTITLTSRSGEIPLTFRNETGFPIRLRAALASDKLFFPHGAVLDFELPPKSTTLRVAVEARTSGTFPLDLEVTSTDGVLSISHRRLQVRSTFVSTVGVVLMASAVAFLALWWGLDLRRRRRRRRQPTTT